MHAVRNISLCTKDCLCLFVCPTGATDTETGQIDFDQCLDGCRLCVDACPSHAISLMPRDFAPQQPKTAAVTDTLQALAASKTRQEMIARAIHAKAETTHQKRLAAALVRSCRILAEDAYRESGYMLPQGAPTRQLLESLLEMELPDDFPRDAVQSLLDRLPQPR